MTPLQNRGWHVGDKFVLTPAAKAYPKEHTRACLGTSPDAVFTLADDDGSDCPLFTTTECSYKHGPDGTPGAYVHLGLLTPQLAG